MSIEPYNRNDPDGPDSTTFGDDWLQAKSGLLSEICPEWIKRTADLPFWFPEGRKHISAGVVPASSSFLDPCLASFGSGIIEPGPVTCIYPDTILILERRGERFLLEETCWHTELYFHDDFRCDRSTTWRWRYRNFESDVTVDGRTVVAWNSLAHIYFHWFFDVVSKIWLFKNSGDRASTKFFVGSLDFSFQKDCLEILGIDANDVVEAPRTPLKIKFEDGIVPVSVFREPLKTRFSRDRGIHFKGWSADFVSSFRELARVHFEIPLVVPHLKLYIDRGDAGYRKVLNNGDVIDLCQAHGFHVVTPGQLSLKDQIALFFQATTVVGCHGAGLTNVMWMRPGGTVIEFMPKSYDDAGFRFLSGIVGAHYHCIFSQSDEDRPDCFWADCTVDLVLLEQILKNI